MCAEVRGDKASRARRLSWPAAFHSLDDIIDLATGAQVCTGVEELYHARRGTPSLLGLGSVFGKKGQAHRARVKNDEKERLIKMNFHKPDIPAHRQHSRDVIESTGKLRPHLCKFALRLENTMASIVAFQRCRRRFRHPCLPVIARLAARVDAPWRLSQCNPLSLLGIAYEDRGREDQNEAVNTEGRS
jgi:hypothetical protein